jgi:hypothetical protein
MLVVAFAALTLAWSIEFIKVRRDESAYRAVSPTTFHPDDSVSSETKGSASYDARKAQQVAPSTEKGSGYVNY